MNIAELQEIFEYEIKRKLAQRSRSPQEELRKLISAFKFFDYESKFIIDKNQWIKGVLKTGLCGFNIKDLESIFERYDPNKTGFINYINFSNHVYGKEELLPISSNFENHKIDNGNNIFNNKGNIKEFKPPGLYERNFENLIKEKQLSHYNNSESLLNDFNLNNNKSNNNNFSEDNNISKSKNYHITKSQSQILSPNKSDVNNINNNNTNYIQDNLKNNNSINSNNYQNNLSNNNKTNNNNNNENKNYFQKLINIFRNKINVNNGIAYYTFAQGLKSLEDKNTNSTSIENLLSVIEQMGLDINQDELINFYSILDYTQSNKVSTNEILRLIRGEISEQRKILIVTKFAVLDKEKTGIISISLVKELYNFKFHPDVFLGKKSAEQIYKEFLYTFDIFCELNGLKDAISYKDFIEYYTPISASILNDNYFDDIILGVWNIEENNTGININKNNNYYNEENIQIDKKNINDNKLSKSQNIIREPQARTFSPNRNQEFAQKQRMTPYYNPRTSPDGKGLKMFRQLRFNPLTNEYIMSPEKNIDPNNNQNFEINNNSNINTNISINNNNNISNNPDSIGLQKINLLRELLAKRGHKSIFIIQRMFYIYDNNQTGQIPFDKLCDIFEIYNINLTKEDIFDFFNILDKEHKGIIKYNDLIKILIDNINQNREMLIQKLFQNFNKGNGFVLINDLKQKFNPMKHPDAINQSRNQEEILLDYIDSLEIFMEYNGNLNNENIKNGYMSFEDFSNFFKEISMSIIDDKLFDYLINNCWISDNIPEKNMLNNNYEYGNDNVRIRAGKQIINNF
jgi:Ca2+-binding EF-hand superfamily protein